MNTIFRNSGDSKSSDPYRLLLNLSDKKNLKMSDKCVGLSPLTIYSMEKYKKFIQKQ